MDKEYSGLIGSDTTGCGFQIKPKGHPKALAMTRRNLQKQIFLYSKSKASLEMLFLVVVAESSKKLTTTICWHQSTLSLSLSLMAVLTPSTSEMQPAPSPLTRRSSHSGPALVF